LLGASLAALPAFAATPESFVDLERQYAQGTLPLLKRFCLECHSTADMQGELDLERFHTLADVRRAPRVWQKVVEMLDNREMPPKESDQPSPDERKQLRSWIERYLNAEAHASVGDPGPVVLRRLSNAEYTYTVRDLTDVELSPAREFPADGAAGEGFTNAGNALVMSPALLTKYLAAGKEIADHAVLLPDGFRFSPSTTPRDWTEEYLTQIREFYRQFTATGGGERVNLQGVTFDTNADGRLPIEKYLAATLVAREALKSGSKTIAVAAREHGLNAKYLGLLWSTLNDSKSSLVLDDLRTRWAGAKPNDAAALAAFVEAWQKSLFKFSTVGHIGKVGGPKRWLEPVGPLVARHDVRFKIPAPADGQDVTLSLVATDAGDGNEHDFVVWQQPRLVAPGRPDLLLRDVRSVVESLSARRAQMLASTSKYLRAAEEAAEAHGQANVEKLASRHGVDAAGLKSWLDYLGIGTGGAAEVRDHFTTKIMGGAGYEFIQGWGSSATPQVLANSSGQHVRIPGNMKPHSIAVHPSPKLRVAVGWRSPMSGTFRIEPQVTHAHPECGNGVTWSLELRRGAIRKRLAAGVAQGTKENKIEPLANVTIESGDLVSLVIGPRDGNHSCDLTAVEVKLTDRDSTKSWSLAGDVSSDVLAGNPHADRQGNSGVWHFYTEPNDGNEPTSVGPADDSLAGQWQATRDVNEKRRLAEALEKLLTSPSPADANSPDAALYRQLTSLTGPLVGSLLRVPSNSTSTSASATNKDADWGLDPALFGKHPNGSAIDATSLCIHAPTALTFRLPAELAAGCELVAMGILDPSTGAEGSVQLAVTVGQPPRESGLHPTEVTVKALGGQWTGNNREASYAAPILVNESSQARKAIEKAFDDFRELFPAALCYTKIVPVDEVVTLVLYHREDDHLVRLMLDDAQRAQLDRLWDELHYVSRDALALVDAFAQLMEYATQDANPKVFEPLRQPILDRAAAFKQRLLDTEPKQLDALVDFAARVYRRPLTASEVDQMRGLYKKLRDDSLPHEEAFRLVLARQFIAPAFLYRLEAAPAGKQAGPVNDWELATRLSYFLWSSLPDEELSRTAAAGRLRDPEVLVSQTRRMLADPRVRRLATEFACQWLHIYEFDTLDEKSERHFPTFASLRGDMYEEAIRFFTDLVQRDGSVLAIWNADHTFVNEALAKHYGIDGVTGDQWRRVDGLHKLGRGGILGLSATLAKQAGASRTSPILRGNWVSEVLLGEKLPKPPKDVPRLPDDEAATEGLTVRQLVEKHSSDARCASCHARIDPIGFALEGFDAIGRRRTKDLASRPIETQAKTLDGAQFDGLEGLRNYLLTTRRDALLRQFGRKLLGYALGRGVQLSDEPLLDEMQQQLKSHDYRFSAAVETIIRSRPFREIRGQDAEIADNGF
jgi:hypothetical protein